MSFVLDASIALAWCFSDEKTEQTLRLLEKLIANEAYVPAIWPLELSNILLNSVKSKRMSYAEVRQFLELISSLNIKIDDETASRAFHEILALSFSEKLTIYDASYLELAMRLGLPLATKDKQMIQAAKRLGINVLSDS